MENLLSFKRQLERERFRKVKALRSVYNPLEREFLERDVRLIDLQLQWVDAALNPVRCQRQAEAAIGSKD